VAVHYPVRRKKTNSLEHYPATWKIIAPIQGFFTPLRFVQNDNAWFEKKGSPCYGRAFFADYLQIGLNFILELVSPASAGVPLLAGALGVN